METGYRTHGYDGIIVGGGGAGLMAAIRAHEQGAKVAVVMKCMLGKAHTVVAEGGIAAAIMDGDSPERHFVDTMLWGHGLNNYESAWKLANGAKDAIYYLESKGAIFERDESGRMGTRIFAGHSQSRACYVGERVGHAMIHTLKNEVLRLGIPFYEKTMITKLIVRKNRVCGAAGIDIRTGEFVLFDARFVILATGGCGGLYRYTTNSKDVTADGVSLGYEAGAELMDMEMVQFHSTCLAEPEEKRGALVSEVCAAQGGILINAKGERFMAAAQRANVRPEYAGKARHNDMEDSDIAARAVEEQYARGLGPVKLIACREAWHGEAKRIGVPEGLRSLVDPGKMMDRKGALRSLPITAEQLRKFAGVDITREGMAVRPAQHHMMGGLRVDPGNYMTSVRGIFAAGETSAGMHGANRLMGNSLMETMVSGMEAGRGAAEYARRAGPADSPDGEAEAEFSRLQDILGDGGLRQAAVREELRSLMWKRAWIIRDGPGLQAALGELERLGEKAARIRVPGGRAGNVAWQEAVETMGMVSAAEAILRSALAREESRGPIAGRIIPAPAGSGSSTSYAVRARMA